MAKAKTPDEVKSCGPVAVRIDALLTRTRFDSPLLHYTDEQWTFSLAEVEPVKELSDDAVRMVAFDLPGNHGVVANPFFRCPPGCEPIGGRGLVCPDFGIFERLPDMDNPVGYTPHPDCWFEPQCFCELDKDEFDKPKPKPKDCDHANCRLGFLPVVFKPHDHVITITRFGCRKIDGDCKECRIVVERSPEPLGLYRLGCECLC